MLRFSMMTMMFFLLIVITICASLVLFFLPSSPPIKTSTIQNAHQPDAFMEHVSATILNDSGNPSMLIKSPRINHYSKNDTTEISKPQVTIYRNTLEPWYINAERGVAKHGMDSIIFTRHVSVRHPIDKINPQMELKTESLTVFPHHETVSTKEAVTITQPDATIHAIGMNADFNTGTIHLLADTRSEYVPSS